MTATFAIFALRALLGSVVGLLGLLLAAAIVLATLNITVWWS